MSPNFSVSALMQPGRLANWQTRAQSLSLVPVGPQEKITWAPSLIVTPQAGQISLLIENFGLETPSFSEAKDGFILP